MTVIVAYVICPIFLDNWWSYSVWWVPIHFVTATVKHQKYVGTGGTRSRSSRTEFRVESGFV